MKWKTSKLINKPLNNILGFFLTICFPMILSAESSIPENMILINAGGFVRGIDQNSIGQDKKNNSVVVKNIPVSEKAFDDEGPARMIYISSYYIDTYEVSNDQYEKFIRATDHAAPAYWDHRQLNKPNHPVTGVNWYDSTSYCRWINKRLPTEAEWEKAARGPAGLIYPWGNDLDHKKANFQKGKTGQKMVTTPVDSYPEGKSYYGLFNMAGNVFEWVQDWYDPNYYKNSKDVRNVKGPQLGIQFGISGTYGSQLKYGEKKVIRGGSWFAPAQSITTTHRFWNDPMNNSYGVGLGFRCARDVEDNSRMKARSYFMEALVQMGAEKYKKALRAINSAISINPNNEEYKTLKVTIEKRIDL